MFIVLIGAPGAGKGTQGQFLAKELHLSYLSTGDMFRSIIEKQEPEGKLMNDYSSQGKLIPTDLVNKMVYKFLLMDEYQDNCILDGYPRNLAQAKFLDKIVNELKAIYFEISETVAKQRILGRFSCEVCLKTYNKYYAKPKIEGICDICGSNKFIYRADDDEVTINKRMQEYKIETQPMIQYYRDCNKLLTVDANLSQDQISSTLLALL
ncbi:adenylate kinase [Candidatus Trichorickettsia mobilis]|uniref:adenylate kinase n=1 Tax=Candidatus Trichorickettsia mobilis TaxID=1346319 RepID=UPI00292EDC81|nr:adenylate kinase [Candidatus Trichorickettsia mobilis]